jgi:hypothetical protein
MRSKITKTFTKKTEIKTRNPKNKDHIEKYNIWWIKIEWWNWKQIKILQKSRDQKLYI